MTLTKNHIINSISNHLDLPKKESAALFNAMLETIKKTLENGEDVLISGFGKFLVKEKNERWGRNPATGDNLTLDARRLVTFKCSGKLREKINDKG